MQRAFSSFVKKATLQERIQVARRADCLVQITDVLTPGNGRLDFTFAADARTRDHSSVVWRSG